jgi:hypothetical protein
LEGISEVDGSASYMESPANASQRRKPLEMNMALLIPRITVTIEGRYNINAPCVERRVAMERMMSCRGELCDVPLDSSLVKAIALGRSIYGYLNSKR